MPPKNKGKGRGRGGVAPGAVSNLPQPGIVEAPVQHTTKTVGGQFPTLSQSQVQPVVAAGSAPVAWRRLETVQNPEPVLKASLPKPVVPKVKDVTKELANFQIAKAPIQSKMPARPGFGTQGRVIKLIANHFEVEIPGGSVYHYDVEIESLRIKPGETPKPDEALTKATPQQVSGKRLNGLLSREVVNHLRNAYRDFAPTLLAYDGNKNLYTRKPLPFDKLKTFIVGFLEDGRQFKSYFKVSIQPVEKDGTSWCEINMEPLKALFKGRVTDVSQEAIQALDVILRSGPAKKMLPLRASLFNIPRYPEDKKILSSGHEVWAGYYQSLRPGQWKPLLNIDKSCTTFYPNSSVIDFICQYLKINLNDIVKLDPNQIRELNKELKNIQIQTTHMPTYKRKYRVFKITNERASQITFEEKKNDVMRKITVDQYFREHPDYKALKYPNFPCLQCGSDTKKIFLPVEVCELTTGQHYRRKLQPTQTAEMIRFTATPPADRFKTITESVKELHHYGRDYMQEFGIKVATEPLHLEGRILNAPNILYKNNATIKVTDGVWDMRNSQFFNGCQVDKWAILSFANDRFCRQDMIQKFAGMLVQHGAQTGVIMPAVTGILNKAADEKRRVPIITIFKELLAKTQGISLVVVVLGRFTNYGEIKQVAETKLGLMTQCIKEESIVKKCNPQLIVNLLQKINAKMGGTNSSLIPGEKPAVFRQPVIIIGADVSHPSPGDRVKPSIAAAVGSIDSIPCKYSCAVRLQKNKDELQSRVEVILELKEMVIELLKSFYRNTKRKPEKIIFFRDGVSEGQFAEIQQTEVRQIREACKTLQEGYEPPITFVVVGKRHHTRFMPENYRDGVGKHKNVPPGTMVDTHVTSPVDFDFFLCSHAGIQGTSRPAHYTVIWDDNKFTADEIQKLTYHMCHTYVRCTRSISIPAPVQYAHLAAYRAKNYLQTICDSGSSSSEEAYSSGEYELPKNICEAINVTDSISPKMYYV